MANPSDDTSKTIAYPGHGIGLRNVGSYQISGHPYITGSLLATGQEMYVSFPNVSREFTVINSGSGAGPVLRVHFNSTSSAGSVIAGHHYVTLESDDQSITFHTKCKGVYVSCASNGGGDNGFEVLANLTSINVASMYDLTGSGLTD
jgi:hypothetical protein